MKAQINLRFTFCILILNFFFTQLLNAGWEKTVSFSSPSFQEVKSESQTMKKDSLPEGVTQDWLNNLVDEYGNKIIPEGNTRRPQDDPETDAMQRRIINGLVPGSNFGYSVSSAGDVNGDGFDDIVVGAPYYSSNTGRAYIYFGGLNMNTVPGVTMTGQAVNNYFGISVSSAGDVNGDGYSDVIAGANGYSNNTGRGYIFFGGSVMNNGADVIITGEYANNYFGFKVSSAGDVNGDGYSDVIAGSFGYGLDSGRAYIFFGGMQMNNTADIVMTGESQNNFFGTSVSSGGDVNGDGYSDVIVGAFQFESNTGRAYIFFGGNSMNNTSDVILTGEDQNINFGISVSSSGDVNGDGYSDVIVGADAYASSKGRAYIYFGGGSMDNTADVILTGETTNNFFGFNVSSAGDVNGDGYFDVIAGASGYSSFTGRAYVYFGGSSMNNIADVTLTGEAEGSYFGNSVSSSGDLNGDGYADVIIGANSYNSNTGRVYLFDYFMKNEITPDVTITGLTGGNRFGFSVSSAGDVNGDGYPDVIVGEDGYSSNTGRVYIFFGSGSMDNIADVTMTGESTNIYFGGSVSSAGDVNGDGYSDVIVGAIGYISNTGRAYIFFGGSSMDNISDVVMTGGAANNHFGNSVSSAGDVNGDGYSDVIVGAHHYSSSTGRSFIFYGGSSMNSTPDVVMVGLATDDHFGFSVSSAGDVNGDGYSDVIVGAFGYNTNTGSTYIFFGGSSMDYAADVTITGAASSNRFGISVSSAGDVNGDGYSDVIVAADTGRAYIFYGGSSMDNTADVTMTGETINNSFGSSVSSAGDVNGDGYSDVIVGAFGYSSNTGRAYIFFGGVPMDNIADVKMTGEAGNNFFGNSVSSVGDINGDGYSDVIAGAHGFISNTGKVYIYTGSAISINPILNYVKDVPNDQGGKVNLKWARSGYDVNGINTITDYVVYRSYPPNGGQFSWELRSVIPATKRTFYSYTDNTPSDSSAGGNGNMYYRIMARTSNSSQYWQSGILYGRSTDNISPPVVAPFSASLSGSNISLSWGSNPAPDLLNYLLFRSTSSTINPHAETPLATVNNTTAYLDSSPLTGIYYYFIVAQDIHNNYSPVAVTQRPDITVNITMFIEGFYKSTSDTQVSDTIRVYLRNLSSPYAIVDSAKSLVSQNGSAQLKFGNATNGTYYIVITHRNSIETWSSSGIAVTNGGSENYNFSNASSQIYGNNIKQIDTAPLRFAIYSGDVNQNGSVDVTDLGLVDNDAFNFVTGYVPTDVTGNNVTDANDLAIVDNNAFNFVSKITPP